MRILALLLLSLLASSAVAAQDGPGAPARRPAACVLSPIHSSALPPAHISHSRIGESWEPDLSDAVIVKDPAVARAWSAGFGFTPAPIEKVRDALTQYLVLSRDDWQHQYSHVGGLDEGGWLVWGGQCFQWMLRPGGLAWIVYPDGTAVYLPAHIHGYTPLIQPSSHGSTIRGPALSLECVATLHNEGEQGLVERFRAKSSAERRVCLDHLLQPITPEPGFTAEDFRRSLKRNRQGDYSLEPDAAIADRMLARVATNVAVAEGIAALASERLIDDPGVLPSLIQCQAHPLLEVGKFCNRALTSLTRHTYGAQFFDRSMNSPARTMENLRGILTDWWNLNRLLSSGRPIFDESLASESLAAVQAVFARLRATLRPLPQLEAYLHGPLESLPWGEFERICQAAVAAVREGLAGLRAANARASR